MQRLRIKRHSGRSQWRPYELEDAPENSAEEVFATSEDIGGRHYSTLGIDKIGEVDLTRWDRAKFRQNKCAANIEKVLNPSWTESSPGFGYMRFIDKAGNRFERDQGDADCYFSTWFGVKADGVTDDKPAFLACIEYVESMGGGTIKTPKTQAGVFLGGSISFKGNITFDGGGNRFLTSGIRDDYDSSGAVIMAGYLSAEGVGPDIYNAHIVNCHAEDTEPSRPFYMSSCRGSSISYCSVKNNTSAFFFRRGGGNTIHHCYASNLVHQMIAGDGDSGGSTVTGSLTVSDCVQDGGTSFAVDVRNEGNLIIQGCQFFNVSGFFKNNGVGRVIAKGNHVEIAADASDLFYGIQFHGDSKSYIVENNYILDKSSNPTFAFMGGCSRHQVVHNEIESLSVGLYGMCRVSANAAISRIKFKDNIITIGESRGYIWHTGTGATMTRMDISDNDIEQGENQTGDGPRYTLQLSNITNSKINGNTININHDAGTAGSHRGIRFDGTNTGNQLCKNIILAGTNGGAAYGLDIRLLRDSTVTGNHVNASYSCITRTADDGNDVSGNFENGVKVA